MDLPQPGGALGGCADITALPPLKSIQNVTFLGPGCGIKSATGRCELMLGMPGGMIEKVHAHIMDMAKPIAMLNKSRQNPLIGHYRQHDPAAVAPGPSDQVPPSLTPCLWKTLS